MRSGRRFHLERRIGAGAYGEVFLAEQEGAAGFKKRVAIKLLHGRLEGMSEAATRFRDEARILGRLSHRHIVTVLDLIQLDGRWAVVMDYVPGADLEAVLEALARTGDGFPVPAALEAAAAILEALHAAHFADDGRGGQLGVVHRDIKPSNVRLTRDGDLKVLDFGVASVDMDSRESTTGLHRMGTERYMAPERMIGHESGPAGDVYAVGATLAELILGEPLGRTPVIDERHEAFVAERIERIRARLGDHADRVLPELIAALAVEPDDRPEARVWSAALHEAARAIPGESLKQFAGRFVPEIDAVLDRADEPLTGVLSEAIEPTAHPTLIPPAETGSTSLPVEREAVAALGIGLAAGLAALAAVALLAIAVVGIPRDAAPP